MKTVTIISLLLVFAGERINSDERPIHYSLDEASEKKILMANMMITIEAKLKDIHQYCKQDSSRDSDTLRGMANKLESSLSNDQLSMASSTGGILGSLMVATSFIPSPFSVPLFYYGGYLTAASTAGHVGNVAVKLLQEDIDEDELHSVLYRVQQFHANIHIYEVTREGLGKFPEGAKLLVEDRHVTFSEAESEKMLDKLRNVDRKASSILRRERVNLSELADLCKNIYEILKLFKDHGLNPGWNLEAYEGVEGSIRELAVGSESAIKEFEMEGIATGISGMRSALSGGAQIAGAKFSNIISGVASVLTIYFEARNIESTEQHMRNKNDMIHELREIARNLRKTCRKSMACM